MFAFFVAALWAVARGCSPSCPPDKREICTLGFVLSDCTGFLGCAENEEACKALLPGNLSGGPEDDGPPLPGGADCDDFDNDPDTGLNRRCNFAGTCVDGDCYCCELDEETLEPKLYHDGLIGYVQDCKRWQGAKYGESISSGINRKCIEQSQYASFFVHYYMPLGQSGNVQFTCDSGRARFYNGVFFDEVAQREFEVQGYFGKISPYECRECTVADPCQSSFAPGFKEHTNGYLVSIGTDLHTYYDISCHDPSVPIPSFYRHAACEANYDQGYKAVLSIQRAVHNEHHLKHLNYALRKSVKGARRFMWRSAQDLKNIDDVVNTGPPKAQTRDPCGFITKYGKEKTCEKESCCMMRGGCRWTGMECITGTFGVRSDWGYDNAPQATCYGDNMIKGVAKNGKSKPLQFTSLDSAKAACWDDPTCQLVTTRKQKAKRREYYLCTGGFELKSGAFGYTKELVLL